MSTPKTSIYIDEKVPGGDWRPTHLDDLTEDDAERKLDAFRRSMPDNEYRVRMWTQPTGDFGDDDIPF